MPGKRIKDLTPLSGAGSANNDDVVIFDADADATKRISRSQLAEGMQGDVQVFSNKTINLGSNTLTGTTAQFNTALSDNNFATQAGSETLTNKTIDSANNTLTVNYKEARVETSDASRTHLFTTVAALLADTGTYTTYAAGQIVEAGGFRYQVAASGASDHHVATAGGVKLYVLPDTGGYNVKAFGAVADGVADDSAAVQTAIECLKLNGGGTLYFPGFCKVNTTISLYGSITGGPTLSAPSPKRIVFASNGNGGLKAGMTSGDVIRFTTAIASLNWKPSFQNFVIDCDQKNITGINGRPYSGNYAENHFVEVSNLSIVNASGAASIGIDGGTITDSTFYNLVISGGSSGVAIGFKIEKANNKLIDPLFAYCLKAIALTTLPEAQAMVSGGRFLVNEYDLYYAEDFSYANASVFNGTFLGEKDPAGTGSPARYIVGRAATASLDISSLSFIGCQFDTVRTSDLIDFDFGGRFSFIGCFCLYTAPAVSTVKFGQFATVLWFGNTRMSINSASGAITQKQINNLLTQNVTGVTGGIDAAAGVDRQTLDFYKTSVASGTTFIRLQRNASTLNTGIRMPFAGSIVGIAFQSSSTLTVGSMTAQVTKNGGGIGSCDCTLAAGTRSIARNTFAFAAGDTIGVDVYADNPFSPTPVDLSVTVIVAI